MVEIFTEPYENRYRPGSSEKLNAGYRYKKKAESMIVPQGYTVTFYENQDLTGKKSYTFYEGTYSTLKFYGIDPHPGCIHVERTELTHLDMVEVQWLRPYSTGKTLMRLKVPVGERTAFKDFPNDKIDILVIPFGLTCQVAEDNVDKGSLFFSGDEEGKDAKIDLSQFDYDDKISNMIVSSDDWVSAGVALENEVISPSEDKVANTIELANNSEHTGSITGTIQYDIQETVEENWNVEAGVTAKTGFEVGPENAKWSGEIEVSVSGGYGESKSTTKTKSFEQSVAAEVEGFGKVKASMIVEQGTMEADAVRKWRNKRTNYIIEQKGRVKFNYAMKTRVEIH